MINVLVVDDDDLVCDLICIKLAMSNYRVTAVGDGKAALAQLSRTHLSQERPDIILLDQMMPILSGSEFLLHIKARPQFRSIPVIMLSLRNSEADIATAIAQGAADYIVKPFVPDALAQRIEAVLYRHNATSRTVKKIAMAAALPLACYAPSALALPVPDASPLMGDPYQQAATAHEHNYHDAAIQILQRLTVSEPDNADNWLRLGLEHSHMDAWEDAEAALSKAIALAPDYTDAQDAIKNVRRWKAAMLAAATLSPAKLSPRLGGTDISEPQARANGRDQFSVAISQSFGKYADRTKPAGRESLVVASYSPHAKATYLAQLEISKRFGQADITAGLQGDWRIASNAFVYAGGTVSKNPAFRENWSLRAGGGVRPIQNAEIMLDARISNYRLPNQSLPNQRKGTFVSATPKAAISALSNRVTATAGWINVWNENGMHLSGWSLRADIAPNDNLNLYAGSARYPDTEAGITRRTSVQFAGGSVAVRYNLRFSLGIEKEQRQFSSSVQRVSFGLRWKINQRN
jgi:YaiO family outer membrane protein